MSLSFTGRCSSKQYAKMKRTRWGPKLWVLSESTTGYTINFDVYTGKRWAPDQDPDQQAKGQAYTVTMHLLQKGGCLNKGHHVVVDK